MTQNEPVDSRSAWRTVAASVEGLSHKQVGRGCEDRYHVRRLQTGVALVVADGAGSAQCAAQGAEAAVAGACRYLQEIANARCPTTEAQWRSLLRATLMDARYAVEDALHIVKNTTAPEALCNSALNTATHGTFELNDLATTLTVAILHGGWLAVATIGDGYVVARTGAGEFIAYGKAERSEYINETHFLTDRDFAQRASFDVLPDREIDAVAVLTDGLALLAIDIATGTPYGPFFAPLFAFADRPGADAAELEAFLRSRRVCERTNDDKTLVLAVRRGTRAK